MRTVGLDFGTHQTKVCIEIKEGYELKYRFLTFKDADRKDQFTLPSIIGIGHDGLLSYGYLPHGYDGEIIRYFKQAAFRTSKGANMDQETAMRYSALYLAYILFTLEGEYDQDFTIQMGAPTDSSHLEEARDIAIKILSAAYMLVEETFANDREKFLATDCQTLMSKVRIPKDSEMGAMREEYKMLVFPEAYACLMPLVKASKVSLGMSLIIDIGGGTTDISFFDIENNNEGKENAKEDYRAVVYGFFSIDMGLNFLTGATAENAVGLDSNVRDESELIEENRMAYDDEVTSIIKKDIIHKLYEEWNKKISAPNDKLTRALEKRPIIYTGGGSTFGSLRSEIENFKDIIHISKKDWRTEAVPDMPTISKQQLCPILSTAYGLSIGVSDDNFKRGEFGDILRKVQQAYEDEPHSSWESSYEDMDAVM